jgi:hypothetical protein
VDDFEERVRKRAYRLWQEEGCPEGRATAHWDMARELVAIEDNQSSRSSPFRARGHLVPPVNRSSLSRLWKMSANFQP